MGSLLRSEDMTKLRLLFDDVAAHDTVDELGKVGIFEFEDQNKEASGFQRNYAPYVRRCEEVQRQLRFLEKELKSIGLQPNEDYTQIAEDSLRFDDLEDHLSKLETNIISINNNWKQLQSQYNELLENKHVLEKGAEFFKAAPTISKDNYGSLTSFPPLTDPNSFFSFRRRKSMSGEDMLLHKQSANVSLATPDLLSYTLGVLNQDKVATFDRLLFRASRGNAFSRYAEVEQKLMDTETGEPTDKVVFIIFHFGNEMASKVTKICKAFQANIYPFPEDSDEQAKAYQRATSRLKDLKEIIDSTQSHHRQLLSELVPKLAPWKDYVMREKAIYHSLNLVKTDKKLYRASGWVPTCELDSVRSAVEKGKKRSNSQVQSLMETQEVPQSVHPPTCFKTNRFTKVFQDIVESYAIATYKEVNPAPFLIITFPFLFAVMFGDVGHGIIMSIAAYLVIRAEKTLSAKKLDDISSTIYDGRYIIFLMGLFSIYTGFIYNEFFAVPLNLFGSRWKFTDASEMACGVDNCEIPSGVHPPKHPYPLGFDPIWKPSGSALLFFNSYKMKLSIILGVAQMFLGICLSYKNARYFKEPVDIWYVFVPQMIFFNAIFGYLALLIIIKWCTDYDAPACRSDPNCIPPDIKAILINMFMAPGSVDASTRLYPGQAGVQVLLLLAAVGSVPVLLLAKPLVLKARYEKKLDLKGEATPLLKEGSSGVHDEDDEANHGHGEFEFGEAMVQNMIHTIEFVLGCISNTASYLRLWALSLAHAELSDVFLEKMIYTGAGSGPVVMIICFVMWLGATIAVLMLMESLSAFLHALRLHWVEFQNKFYSLHGAGAKFMPFDYEAMRSEEE
mmetsp:Transcript_9434/g.28487  ORF Transcript_9434/g.28487 Transcript_9434/m.28487 type:complete len:845 (-) Transcript_9434:1242-3776(-)